MIKASLLLLLASLMPLVAKTITASGGTSSAVQSAVDSASEGDTVTIPDGDYTWSTEVKIIKPITLTAATSGKVNITHGNASSKLLNVTANGNPQIAGLNFLPGNAGSGKIYLWRSGSGVAIVHDCSFNIPNFQIDRAVDWQSTGGLFYNDRFYSDYFSSGQGAGSGSGGLRHISQIPWVGASTLGKLDVNGDKNLYFEDCTFDDIYNQCIDADDGSRIVVRYCKINNTQILTHGTTSKDGGRQIEYYKNTCKYSKVENMWVNVNRWIWWRAGTGRVWGNSVDALDSQGYWGGFKPSWVMMAESLTRAGAGSGCQDVSDYQGVHWPGSGGDGSKQVPDPIYFWDNTGTGATKWGTNDQSGSEKTCNGGSSAQVIKDGRDVIFASAAPTGYEPYPYPHPLSAAAGGGPTPEPTPSPSASPTPRPTATPPPATQTWEEWIKKQNNWIRQNPPQPDP